MEHDEDFSVRYWRCLYEFKCRRFPFAVRRFCEAILDLTLKEGRPDVEIPNLEWLADAMFCTPNNLHPVIRTLTEANVLGREDRLKTWWINDIALWKRFRCDDDAADPERARRAEAALARIQRHNRLRSNQSELFPPPTTDAELAAESHQARATDWSATEGSQIVTDPPSLEDVVIPRESLKNRLSSLKIRLQNSNFQSSESKKKTLDDPLLAGAPTPAPPGNPVKKEPELPGKPGKEGSTPPLAQLDKAGWTLFQDLERFCTQGGDKPFCDKYRQQWLWRIRKRPFIVEMILRGAMAHVREGRRPDILNRAGWLKHQWSQEEKRLADHNLKPAGPESLPPTRPQPSN